MGAGVCWGVGSRSREIKASLFGGEQGFKIRIKFKQISEAPVSCKHKKEERDNQ